MAVPMKYTAMRLCREPGKDEFDRHFSLVWETAHELIDPVRLFEEVTAQNGEVWALWPVSFQSEEGRTYVDQYEPHFLLMKHPSGEAMMLADSYSLDIRELSYAKDYSD